MLHESEKQTRKQRIDALLGKAGWKILPYSDQLPLASLTNHAIEEYPTANGPADYALFVKGHLFGIVEAKKVEAGAANGFYQQKRSDLTQKFIFYVTSYYSQRSE